MLTKNIENLSKEEFLGLLTDASLNLLAHDGLRFQAAEEKYGMKEASLCNQSAIASYSAIKENQSNSF